MTVVQKFMAILGLALVLFFIPVFIQEHEVFLDPLFSKTTAQSLGNHAEEEAVRNAVRNYNSILGTFYTERDARALSTLPAGEKIKKNLLLEMEFLRGERLSPGSSLVRLDMGKVRWLDTTVASLPTVEVWGKEKNHMVYTVENIKGQWMITDSSLDPFGGANPP